ncbi:pre-mRNA-splicing factor [Anaerotruncus colihominis]|uniref:Pre-mRNA-splicing factor n=1 Tax=Anaerotruncus colihominis TaxID=169435 RepID=A0A1Y4MDV8_9FIRM|nr:pre-mRNA-splicing factor [Anaerotruncus colihominis]OUP66967.1 pre-mRNA-splicing factor [Anaerotruncus colihominis]
MAQIEKGKISTIEGPADRNGDNTRARVLPSTRAAEPSRPLVIPWWLRGQMGALSPGTEVVFAVFEDLTGFLIGRTDGEWPGIVPGDVTVTGKATVEDMITEQVPSYNGHRHGGIMGGPGDTGNPK